ncbi:MAG: acyltransferase family protein [Pseudolabrys sp.]|nr:acyltransferase family protein [Pseudolabrys sp.]
MNGTDKMSVQMHDGRVDWVDYAKGFCIVFVVMMHSVLGVEAAAGQTGWMNHVVEFARPFRMPDFFMISGLFLALVIDRDWRTYLDRKVVHFFYFYVLWTAIQFAFKAPGFIAEQGVAGVAHAYLMSFIEPFGTLWFIYLLPIFFVFIKLTKRVPWPVLWLLGAAMEISHLETGWMVPDEFAARFVYVYTGYIAARYIFSITAWAQARPQLGMAALVVWGVFNGVMVKAGLAALPFYSLALGLVGAAAVATIAALLSLHDVFKPLRYCGRNSIVIYLAFFLPMAASRAVLLKTGIITDIGTISVLVTASGVIGALLIYWAVRHTPLKFLFERPALFWLVPKKDKPAEKKPEFALQPAE